MSQCHIVTKIGKKNKEKNHAKSSYKASYNDTKTSTPHRSIDLDDAEIKTYYDKMLCEPNAEPSLFELC